MAENKFMDLLSDIDEKYIKDMTEKKEGRKAGGQEEEESFQAAEIVIVEEKKHTLSFARIFSCAAAVLLLTAALFGLNFIRDRLPAENENTTAPEAEKTTENTAATNTDPVVIPIPTAAISDLHSVDFKSLMDETDLSDYPAVDISQIPDIDASYEKIFSNYGDGSDKIITKAIIDTKKCGEYDLSLIGYGLLKDEEVFGDKIIALTGFRIALQKDNKIIASGKLSLNLFQGTDGESNVLGNVLGEDDYEWYMLSADSIAETTEIVDFVDKQIIIARVIGQGIFAPTQFYAAEKGDLILCKRADTNAGSIIEYTGGICEKYDAGSSKVGIYDKLFKKIFEFDFYYATAAYSVKPSDFSSEFDDYIVLENNTVPDINEYALAGAFKERTEKVIEESIPKGILNVRGMENIQLYLVGEHIRTDSENDLKGDQIKCSGLRVLVYDGGSYAGCIPIETEAISTLSMESYARLMPEVFIMNDGTALIVKDLKNSYYGSDSFFAVRDGKFYDSINGDWSYATEDTMPEWMKEVTEDDSVYFDYDHNAVVCGFKRYIFDFDSPEPGGYVYRVYWVE